MCPKKLLFMNGHASIVQENTYRDADVFLPSSRTILLELQNFLHIIVPDTLYRLRVRRVNSNANQESSGPLVEVVQDDGKIVRAVAVAALFFHLREVHTSSNVIRRVLANWRNIADPTSTPKANDNHGGITFHGWN